MAATSGTGDGQAGVGRPAPLLPWFWLAGAAFGSQLAVVQIVSRMSTAATLMPLLLPAAHLILFPFLVRNFRYWGMRLVLAGLLLNVLAMAANGGLMPVEARAVTAVGRIELRDLQVGEPIRGTKNVLLDKDDIHLRFLADGIIVPLPGQMTKAVSPGDILVLSGICLAFVEIVARYRMTRRRHSALFVEPNEATA